MRCKKHLSDPSSTVGVCATCLRERLIFLIAAQAQAQAQAQAHTQAQLTRARSRASEERSRNSDTNPPPLIFPRSVSPYVSRRKSDHSADWHGGADLRDRLFYSTPQLGPSFYGGADCAANSTCNGNEKPLRKRLSKFWSFSNIFRSRSEKSQHDPSCEQSSSLFSTIFHTRRKNQDRSVTTEDSSVGARRRHRRMDRGMSPVRTEELAEDGNQSPSGSGYTSESSPWWRRTPPQTAGTARRSRLGYGKSGSGSGSGMAFCLSPLVRASPNRRWNQKGFPPEIAPTAEKPHLSAAASFCANRSRKLADFGRVNHNR